MNGTRPELPSPAAAAGREWHGFLLRTGAARDGGAPRLHWDVAPGRTGSVAARTEGATTWLLLAPLAGRQLDRLLTSFVEDPSNRDHPEARLDEVFGLVRIDSASNEVRIWNDRLGVQPVYYLQSGSGETIISNHLAWLLLASAHRGRIDHEGWLEQMCFGYCAGSGRTVYEGVRQLEPGSVLAAGRAALSVRRYWRPAYWEGEGAAAAPGPEQAASAAANALRTAGPGDDEQDRLFGLTAGKDSLALIGVFGSGPLRTATFGAPASADVRQAESIARERSFAHSAHPLVPEEELERWAEHVAWQSGGLATCSYVDMAAFIARAVPEGCRFVIGEGGECVRDYLADGSTHGLERLTGEFTTPREYLARSLRGVSASSWENYPAALIADSLRRLDSESADRLPGLSFYREIRMPGNFRLRHAVLSPLRAKSSPFLRRRFMDCCYALPPEYYRRSGLHRGIIAVSSPGLLRYFDEPLTSSVPVQDWPARMSGAAGAVFRASLLRHLEWGHGAVDEDGVRRLIEASAAKPGREIYHLLRLWSFLLFRRMLDEARMLPTPSQTGSGAAH